MKSPSGKVSPIARGATISVAALFLLFLSLSQPHKVHHFFERYTHSHDKPEVDSENHHHGEEQSKPIQSNCAVQSAAQNCQLGQVDFVKAPFIEFAVESFHPPSAPWVDSFAFLPFLQRAPPAAMLLS